SISGTGDITANGGLSISGNATLDGRTLINNGTALWTSAGSTVFTFIRGAVFINSPGATFDCAGAGILSSAGANSFVNRGLLRKGSDTNEVRIDASVENTGEIEIETGLLRLGGGGKNFSEVRVAALAGLSLSGGTYELPPEASFTGDGDFRVDGAIANLAGL